MLGVLFWEKFSMHSHRTCALFVSSRSLAHCHNIHLVDRKRELLFRPNKVASISFHEEGGLSVSEVCFVCPFVWGCFSLQEKSGQGILFFCKSTIMHLFLTLHSVIQGLQRPPKTPADRFLPVLSQSIEPFMISEVSMLYHISHKYFSYKTFHLK